MPAASPAAAANPQGRARLISRSKAARSPGRAAAFSTLLACAALVQVAAPASAFAQQLELAKAPPAANAIAVAIRDQASGRLRAFYRPRGYWPLWIKGDALGPQAELFLKLLATADLDGLKPGSYDLKGLERAVEAARGGDPQALARAEVKLSQSLAAYVRDLREPAVKMTYLDKELVPERQREDEVLRLASLPPSFVDYVKNMGWMSPFYVRLRETIGRYRDRWHELPTVTVPSGPALKSGAKGERVALLRRRLGLPAGSVFDKALAMRLKAFQADHGLPAQGIAGEQTLAVLNRGPADYERLLRLNLERARLLPGAWTRHVVVDAAHARLWYYGDGKEQGSMRVVVGTPETPTPMLAGMVRYAILNPYWNVPADLVQSRIAKRVLSGQSFTKLRYQALSDWTANPQVLDPATIDWNAVAAGRQEVRVRQLPGGANAMGRVKFMFPNDQGIYLHDTPDRALFAKPARQFSNGCVRLEDAPRLGKWLLGKPLAPVGGAPEQNVPVPKPVPVYLTYFTALPTGQAVTFAEDVYGRDGGKQLAGR